MRKKLLSLLLAALMILGLLPAAALAADGDAAPTLASGVTLYKVVKPEGEAYTADVTKFFTDEDNDPLTYYVSVNGGEFEKLENPGAYTYAYGKDFVRVRLEFKANDGSADSVSNPTVILNNPDYPVAVGATGSAVTTETGKAVQLGIGNLIKHPKQQAISFSVSIDGGEYKSITLSNNSYTYAPTKVGEHTLCFKAATSTGKESDVYTWTVTATGTDIENHAPIVKSAPEGPGQLGESCEVTAWKPDLASIFYDEDGDPLTYAYRIDSEDFNEYYPEVGIHYSYLTTDGSHTVTIRATDPYGEYAEFTVTIEKVTNHLPTKRANAPDAVSVFVPVGLTYTVDANLYYEDADEKDQGKLSFCSDRFGKAGSYTAVTAGAIKTESAYGYDGTDRCIEDEKISITYTAIAIKEEKSLEAGAVYTLNVADLGLAGNVKVRVNAGAEQAVEGDTFTYTVPEDVGEYILHFYSNKTATAEDNYVVKITVGLTVWPKITAFTASEASGTKVTALGETANPTLAVKDIRIEQYEELQPSADGTKKIAGCITVEVADNFIEKGRSALQIRGCEATAEDGATAIISEKVALQKLKNYEKEAAVAVTSGNVTVYYNLKAVPAPDYTPIVTIGDVSYDVVLTTAKGDEKFWDQGEEVDIYKVTVPANFETLTVSAKYSGFVFCNCNKVTYAPSVSIPAEIPKHICKYQEGFVTEPGQVIDDQHEYIYLTLYNDDQQTGLIVEFDKGGETGFAPGIGNGSAGGTTENGVTTFPAGTGTGAPTVTVTAPADGWKISENTFTVACEKACVVILKSGDTYTKLTAADADGVHSFNAELAEGNEIIVRLKGDVNGDGVVNALDAMLVSRACLSEGHTAYQALDALPLCVVGTPSALAAMEINRACLSSTHPAYQALTW